MKIKITVEPFYSIKWPMLEIKLNNISVFNDICEPNHSKFFIKEIYLEEVNDINLLEITHYDKKGKETILDDDGNTVSDRAIMLHSIEFNELKVPEIILYKNRFYPNWPGQPAYTTNNLYFGFNGTYEFTFGPDSEKMYFEYLLEKEKLANINNMKLITNPDGSVVESFEFIGKLVDSNKAESITIDELYNQVQNEK